MSITAFFKPVASLLQVDSPRRSVRSSNASRDSAGCKLVDTQKDGALSARKTPKRKRNSIQQCSPVNAEQAAEVAESKNTGILETRERPVVVESQKVMDGKENVPEGQDIDSAPHETDGQAAAEQTGGTGVADYEQMRQQNIQRNNALLMSLDIPVMPAKAENEDVPGGKRSRGKRGKPLAALAGIERRSSSRLSKSAEEREALVQLPSTWEDDDAEARKAKKRKAYQVEEDEMDLASLRPPPSMEELLDELTVMQKTHVEQAGIAPRDGDWKRVAKDRWGPLVGRSGGVEDWEQFVTSRMSVQPDATGSEMLQEDYCDCVWTELVACLLMSRVSSHITKQTCINDFLHAFPTPSAFYVTSDAEVQPVINPLGLFDSRIRSLRALVDRFLSMPRFMVGMEAPMKIYGVGKFTYESYLLFCCGKGRDIDPEDKTLAAYCRWLRKQPPGQRAIGSEEEEDTTVQP